MLMAVLLCCVIVGSWAAIARGPLPEKPEKYKDLEGCYIQESDILLPFDSSIASKSKCEEYRCTQTAILYVSCGSVAPGPGQKLVEDKDKFYPDCCPRPVPDS